MKITERTIQYLSKAIAGDVDYMPYKWWPKLVDFFVEFWSNDYYGQGFPTRWRYVQDKLRVYNNSHILKQIIEYSLDPRDFIYENLDIEKAVEEYNNFLKFDNYSIKKVWEFYKVFDNKWILVKTSQVDEINHDFINEQIKKCFIKLENWDYNWSITNSRSLLEAVIVEVIEKRSWDKYKNNWNLLKLFKDLKKIFNFDIKNNEYPESVVQILSWLDSIVNWMANLSNNFADRHANNNITKKYHAKLAINSTMTLSDFLLDILEFKHD